MGQFFFSNKIITYASNPKKNPLFISIKKEKPYDLKYENNTKSKDNHLENRLTTYIDSNNVDERLPYKSFSIEMLKLNNEYGTLVDDILPKKKTIKSFRHFPHWKRRNRENICFNVHHSKHATILHMKTPNTDPLKSIIMKLTYIGKQTFNINGTMIHSSLAIPIHINFNKLNDESSDILI
jgi:hypothetical protein